MNRGQLLTYDLLLERLWDSGGQFVDKHALAVNVNRLRGKIEDKNHRYISNAVSYTHLDVYKRQIIMTLVFVYITTSTKYGKKVYAVGSNMKGAQMAGINTAVVKISVFVIAGALVGIGAFLWIAMNASADPATTGNSYEMYAIAAAVLGGISMSGGKGKCLGILFGAMSYTIIDKIIVSLKMDSLINNAIKGIILLIVIMVQIVGPQIKQKFKKTE